ncbi:CoA transferase [Candidatus Amarobacter glycogenicus]|uniref:CaiB/BaiF CoA transferase family protein n=1 Tax=Candidatus Amarobacter glycogenicus TaxID=3140699 RepID=UPI002A0C9348|nr:CoA transferase [Dehalococcoidia bacterium]
MSKRPLEGLRVADFSWFGAGPIAANTLCHFGAEVVRIESETKVDGIRMVHPFAMNPDGTFKSGYNVSGYFNNYNTGKLSMSLNLNTEDHEGEPEHHRRVRADAGARRTTPRFPWLRGGADSCYRHQRDVGLPERPPFGIGTNYPDYVINPGHTVTAMLAAHRYRLKTGKGQCVELPQLESVVNALGTAVAERLANGTNPTRTGNRHPAYSPHGAFRCADDPGSVNSPDRWVVVACRDDAEWMRVAGVLGHGDIAQDGRFNSLVARKDNEDELEGLVNSWTAGWKAEELCAALQAAGVPAGVVQNAQDMLDRDPHLKAREYYQYVEHAEAGREAHDSPAARLSETPGWVPGPAPLMGEHTMDVCERIIGLTMDEIADLLAEGVLV